MNELVLPPASHWYKSSVMACSPDNALIYGSKNDIVIIKEKTPEEPVQVQMIHGAHSKHITSVSLNKKWQDPYAYIASAGEDNVIKVWNANTLEKKASHRDHIDHKEAVIGAVFGGDDRIISAATHGYVIVWNINTNETKHLKDLFKFPRVTITCISSCPHVGWLVAFGLHNGCVIVADVRRSGQTLYTLKGHYKAVVSLSWCPAPVNVFPQTVHNKVKNKAPCLDTSITFDYIEPPADKLQNETQEKQIDSENIKSNDNLTQNAEAKSIEKAKTAEGELQDFLKECDDLKKQILGLGVVKRRSEQVKPSTQQEKEVKQMKGEEQVMDETEDMESHEVACGRPLPNILDPAVDFLDTLDDDTDYNQTVESEDRELKSVEACVKTEKIEENKEQTPEEVEKKDLLVEQSISSENSEDNVENEKVEHQTEEMKGREEKSVSSENISEENTKKDEEPNAEDSGTIKDDSPKGVEQTEEEPRKEYLLASASKDKSVFIWRAGTDGRMQTSFYSSKSRWNRKERNGSTFISVCWVTPDTLLTSSPTGEILAWPLPKPKEDSAQFWLVHNEHSSHVFNIVTASKCTSPYNWRDKTDLNIWTWSQSGKFVNYDLNTKKARYNYQTISATITCFAPSPLDPNRLAIGLRDGGIRLWDLSLPHTNVVKMKKHQNKFTYKVSVMAWHPSKEMILGFGTEEGRVGFFDLNSLKATLFPHYFQIQVYKVEWGPIQADTSNLGLYAVSEGKMIIYDMQNPNDDPIFLQLPEKLYIYKFAWKPDFTLLLLSGKDGSLIILKPDLEAIATFYPNEKGLNGIVWHPDAFTDKIDVSPRCYWFAATTTKGVLVFDCASAKEDDNVADRIVATFEGHLRPPLALVWCPFEGNRIVSMAPDGLILVWDVPTKSLISTLVDPYFSYQCAIIWSPADPDFIITGDRLLKIRSISKNPPKIDDEFLAARKRLLTKSSRYEGAKVEINAIKVNISLKPKSKNSIVPVFHVSNDENIGAQVENMRKLMSDEDQSLDESDPLQIFAGKEQVSHLLDANYRQQTKEGKHELCEMISLWKGNVGEYIQNAINENRVTPSIITLAPMVSPKLWQDACLTYARKLSEDANSDPLETAMYFLVCHEIEEAINCLCLNSMFREALALAKHRLPESSDIVTKVVEEWAEYCKNTGNFENAAYCYLSIKDYENAAKVLSRRNHKEFLEFAIELAEKAGNKGLSDSIKFKCTEIQNASQNNDDVKINGVVDKTVPSRIDALLKEIEEKGEQTETSPTVADESQSDKGEEELSNFEETPECTQNGEAETEM